MCDSEVLFVFFLFCYFALSFLLNYYQYVVIYFLLINILLK